MIFSIKKRALAGFLSLTMLGTVAASVPFTASAADNLNAKLSIFENKGWSTSTSVVGKANKGLSVEAIKAALSGDDADGATISYKGYENKKWLSGSNGKAIGNANKKLAFEAVSFKLSDVDGYSISYSVYENKKWYSAKDGAYAGHANKGWKIEAIKISITETTPVESLTVSSVTNPADTNVVCGTKAADAIAKLPTTVNATLSDGTAKDGVSVTWSAPANYNDGAVAGTYAFTGVLASIDGVDNTDNVTASANVIVTGSSAVSVATASDVKVANGTAAADAIKKLPTSVTVKLSDGTTKTDAVTWAAPSTYSATTAGTYAFTGTLAAITGVTGTDKVTATINVVVAPVLTVASINNSNLKQFNVVFNTDVDATSAGLKTNYAVTGKTVDSVVLNGNVATVTLTSAFTQQASAVITVSGVKDTYGTTMASVTKTVVMTDTTVPTIVSATVTGPTSLKVTFSEPLSTIGNYTLDNNVYSCTASQDAADYNTVDITLGSTLTDGDHTITVNGANDYANFNVVANSSVKFTYTKDTTAPAVSLVSATQNQVVIKFSKPISTSTQANLSVFHTYNNNNSYKPASTTWGSDNQTVTLKFTGNYLPTGNVTVYVNAGTSPNLVADNWGNAFVSATLTASIVADNTAPAVVSLTGVSSTGIDVKFSKAVTGADNIANYTLKDSTGATVNVISSIVDVNDSTLYHLTTSAMSSGAYTLAIANIKDITVSANAMAAYTGSFTAKDTIAPVLNSTATKSANGMTIQYEYPEAMATSGTGSVLDMNNYLGFPSGTTVATSNNGKTVFFTIPTGSVMGATFTVGHVADASGNYTTAMSTSVSVNGDAIALANIGNIQTVNDTTVSFDVDRQLSAISGAAFTVNGVAPVSYSYQNKSVTIGSTTFNGAHVTLVVANASKWNSASTPAVVIGAGALTSTFGTASSAIVSQTAADKTAPVLASAVVTTPTTIVLTYEEALSTSYINASTYSVAGNTVSSVALSAGNTVVTLNVGTAMTDYATPAVTQVYDIADALAAPNTNVLKASATAISTTDGQAPVIYNVANGAVVTTGTYQSLTPRFDEGTATITFNAGTATAYTSGTPLTAAGVYVLTVTDAAAHPTTVTITIDTTAPTVVSAKMLTATTFQVVFSKAVNASATDFTNYAYDADGAGATAPVSIAVSSISGNGTTTIVVTTAANAGFATGVGTGTVSLGTGIKDIAGNALTAVPSQAIAHD